MGEERASAEAREKKRIGERVFEKETPIQKEQKNFY